MTDTQTTLNQFDQQINELKQRAQTLTGQAKIEGEKQIAELQAKAKTAEAKVKELQSTSGEAWTEMKHGLDQAMEDLKTSYNRAQSHFK